MMIKALTYEGPAPHWSARVVVDAKVGFRLRVMVEVAHAVILASVIVLFDRRGLVAERP